MYLIFDTETTGLPKNWRAPISDTENWPRCVQLAWQVHDEIGNLIESKSYIIKPDNFDIPYESEKIHGISTLLAEAEGIELDSVLNEFNDSISKSKFIIGHNVNFDLNVIGCEFYRRNIISNIESTDILDTCTELTADLCKLAGGRGGKFKLPTLTELHEFLFESSFEEAKNLIINSVDLGAVEGLSGEKKYAVDGRNMEDDSSCLLDLHNYLKARSIL